MKDKTVAWLFVGGIWLMAVSQIYLTVGNRAIGKVNQTYNRATNCFAATSPLNRTPDYVKACYDKAEAATGVKIDRYGGSNK